MRLWWWGPHGAVSVLVRRRALFLSSHVPTKEGHCGHIEKVVVYKSGGILVCLEGRERKREKERVARDEV